MFVQFSLFVFPSNLCNEDSIFITFAISSAFPGSFPDLVARDVTKSALTVRGVGLGVFDVYEEAEGRDRLGEVGERERAEEPARGDVANPARGDVEKPARGEVVRKEVGEVLRVVV